MKKPKQQKHPPYRTLPDIDRFGKRMPMHLFMHVHVKEKLHALANAAKVSPSVWVSTKILEAYDTKNRN